MNTLGPRGPPPVNVEVRSVGGAICFLKPFSPNIEGPGQTITHVKWIYPYEKYWRGWFANSLPKDLELSFCARMWEHMFVKTHASILKGPRRARSQTHTYFWIILAGLGRHKSNMKSMHARMLRARMQDTLNDALPPWECKVKLIHVTEDMCMSFFYKCSLLIGNALVWEARMGPTAANIWKLP